MARPASRDASSAAERAWLWGMPRARSVVLFAAWLGWGFDVFDGLTVFGVAVTPIAAIR